jgi:hypothetical protein
MPSFVVFDPTVVKKITTYVDEQFPSPASQVLVQQITVGTLATQLDANKLRNRRIVMLWNASATHAFLGLAVVGGTPFVGVPTAPAGTGAGVPAGATALTSANGFPIPGGFTVPPLILALVETIDLYALVTTGTADIRVWQESWD